MRASGLRAPLLYARTLRHLRPRQIWGQLRDRLPRVSPKTTPVPPRRESSGKWVSGVPKKRGYLGKNRFRFLNVEDDFDSAGGWFRGRHSYLWYYNLNYFEWVNAPGSEDATAWLRKWIAECPVGSGRSWDPYPVSLRIIQWIRFRLESEPVTDETIDASLAVQARWLSARLETKLLANHYLVNGIALVFAGCFFEGEEADRWLAIGSRIVEGEVREQVLPDGGHFERSVMYHSLVLEDLMNLLNIGRVFPDRIPPRVLEAVEKSVAEMMGWLRGMTLPNGDFPLFNDAAFHVAGDRKELEGYSDRLEIEVPGEPRGNASELFEPSGFAVLKDRDAVLFAEFGGPGPGYQPGHSHAGTLGFELYLNGRAFVVDTGTSTYDPSPVRLAERSTPAHNTLSVENRDSSEVWSAFRLARRATSRVIEWDPESRVLKAGHSGYRVLRLAGEHIREWALEEKRLCIRDSISLRHEQHVAIRFHFHPDLDIGKISETSWLIQGKEIRAVLEGGQTMVYKIEDGFYCPEFGKRLPTKVLVGEFRGSGKFIVRHQISW